MPLSVISASLDPRLDPVIFASTQLLASAAVIGFTAPTSFLRHGFVPLLFACSYSYLVYARRNIPQPYGAISSSILWCFFLNYVSMAIVSGWNFEAKGPDSHIAETAVAAAPPKMDTGSTSRVRAPKAEKKTGSALERMAFGLRSMFSFRDVGSPFEVKNVPPFIYNYPSFVPSATGFVLQSAVTAIACYFIIDFIESRPPPPDAADVFAREKTSVLLRWRDITVQEALTRIEASSGFWVVLSASMMGLSSVINIVCVTLGLSAVENCKSLLGPMSEAYTVRGFWGKSWHQATRKIFATPANYFVDEWFVFQKRSPPNNHSKIFVTFFMSGLLYAIADWASGMDWQASGALKFFYFQAGAILFEDLVQLIYRLIAIRDLQDPPRWWTRMVGYVWVAFFLLFWSTPGWFYPTARMKLGLDHDQGKIIPYDYSYFRKYTKQQ